MPGLYNVTATAVQTDKGFSYTITGAMNDVNFLNDGEEVTLSVDAVKEAALVFKEIYYTGCRFATDDTGGSSNYFRDQFYEIYNNSTQTVYADGLCIAETLYANYDFTIFLVEGPDGKDLCCKVWDVSVRDVKHPEGDYE